ncbi:MAG: UDP-N-acetylglucosamine 2-epimerase (non-hydrolyzing) [Anaerolineaceae bacterium]|nr:UDP-N-acetylglucosamine 2-epimerase (non-hydrolyzing) [Anaerolineaceae bacterium]
MNKKLRVLSIFGTRPEAVKMAPVIMELGQHSEIDSKVCVTAQHRQMLDLVLEAFDIHPDVDLNLMMPNQSLAQISAAIFTHLDPILTEVKPDWILIQGDTATVAVASMVGYYHQVKVGHIEAGLRSFDKWAPFPEEINRRIAGVISDLHFAPTEGNRQNLLREGIPDAIIKVTGNPAIDALKMITSKPMPEKVKALLSEYDIGEGNKRLVLITAHRRENFGKPINDICNALKQLANRYINDTVFIYPVHLNPNIQTPVHQALSGLANLHLIPPLDYLPMAHLMKQATLILTDSGGLQEEAPALGIPTLVLRETTERPEGVEAGTLKLVGSKPDLIFLETSKLLDDPAAYAAMANAVNPYGDGTAAKQIVQALIAHSEQ